MNSEAGKLFSVCSSFLTILSLNLLFLRIAGRRLGPCYPHQHWLSLSNPLHSSQGITLELYSTYIDIEQSGTWAFWLDNPTIDSHMVQV